MEILIAARELGFSLHTEYLAENWKLADITDGRIKIVDFLYEKKWKGSLKSLRKMKVWFIDQLLDSRGNDLFTWQQIRKLLGMKTSGKKASWFRSIEEHTLDSSSKRQIKESLRKNTNNPFTSEFCLKTPSRKISRKEWVLGEDNKENEYIVGRIQKKRRLSSDISPWFRSNKNTLNTSSDQNCTLEQPSENSSIRIRNSSAFDISDWIKSSENGKSLNLPMQHITDTIERKKKLVKKEQIPRDLISIQEENWDITFIKKVITEESARLKLLEVLESNSKDMDLIFYTDGSYRKSTENHRSSLGYGLVQIDSQNRVIRDISGSMQDWFSSTRPELRAILEAVLVSPSKSKVAIFTDSKAAIEAIHNALAIDTTREWLKSTNSSILIAIKEAIQSKNLLFSLHKVKAHSGNLFNEKADKLAKEGAEANSPKEIVEISTKGLVYHPIWKNSPIESPLRSFIKKITNTIYRAEWTFFRGISDEIHRSRVVAKDWKIFRALLRNLKKTQSKTLNENHKRSFVIKCINRALPTLEKRHLQRPDLYSSALCIKCRQERETFEHLVCCPKDIEQWRKEEMRILKKT
jgi:ribonuclease HI